MKVKFLGCKGTWREVANSANTTINKEEGIKEPSSNWKRRMLLCEHSIIRQILIKAKWYKLKYYISVHFSRHFIGILHYVRSQRTDRVNVVKDNITKTILIDNLLQSAPVEHEIEANAQAIINISKKRLCSQALPETREAWKVLLESFKDEQPELYNVCVPDCIYRGWCYEFKSCGFHKTEEYKRKLKDYRDGINI